MARCKAPEILRPKKNDEETYIEKYAAMTCPVRYVTSLFFMVLKKIILLPYVLSLGSFI